MKNLLTILLSAVIMIANVVYCDDRLIPFDDYYISVETNDWMNRRDGMNSLNVTVKISRSAKVSIGSTSIEVNCLEFPAGKTMFLKEDLKLFFDAGAAAVKGEKYRKETLTSTLYGDEITVFETVDSNGGKMIRVNRAGKEALFALSEIVNVKEALVQAQVGKAWFDNLLIAEELPKKMPRAKPPVADSYFLISKLGEISGRGIGYRVSVFSNSVGKEQKYYLRHQLSFLNPSGGGMGSSGGQWVAGLLQEVSSALEAIEKGREYSFESGLEKGRKYTVVANLDTAEADVILFLGDFFKKGAVVKGHYGKEDLVAIEQLIKGHEARMKWFEKHENLFFTRSISSNN